MPPPTTSSSSASCSLRTATGQPKERPGCGTQCSRARSVHFRDDFDFDATAERDLRHAECAARVQSVLAKDRDEQLRRAVGDQVLLGERRSAVHQYQQFDDATDTIEV